MTISLAPTNPLGQSLEINDTELKLWLKDGRVITVPLAWYPKLLNATQEERVNWRWIGDGEGIHWPALDEDLSVRGFLR